MKTMGHHETGRGVCGILDASNTNPRCPTCDRMTRAIDMTRTACRCTGEIFVNEGRAVRVLRRAFAAVDVTGQDV